MICTHAVGAEPTTVESDWLATGLAEITGRPGGAELTPLGAPATLARGLALAIRALGGTVRDGAELLGARTSELDLQRGGTRSASGASQLLETTDGWVALTLSRPSDLDLVPALVGGGPMTREWDSVRAWASTTSSRDLVERAALLGLGVGELGEQSATAPWQLRHVGESHSEAAGPMLVVNLGVLWASPLAAHILHESGARVVEVHTGRRGEESLAWREHLRSGHERVTVDLTSADSRSQLRALLTTADVVLEASRPRALLQLGLAAEQLMPVGRTRAWVRITGHPRPTERVAFGDDAAVAGGLVARDEEGPVFAGDAIADPLSGLTAALLALACSVGGSRWVADVIMSGVSARAAHCDA